MPQRAVGWPVPRAALCMRAACPWLKLWACCKPWERRAGRCAACPTLRGAPRINFLDSELANTGVRPAPAQTGRRRRQPPGLCAAAPGRPHRAHLQQHRGDGVPGLYTLKPNPIRHPLRATAHLQQHGRDEVRGLQQLQVDVHVERHLAPPLQLLLLGRLVLVPARARRRCGRTTCAAAAAPPLPGCWQRHTARCCGNLFSPAHFRNAWPVSLPVRAAQGAARAPRQPWISSSCWRCGLAPQPDMHRCRTEQGRA